MRLEKSGLLVEMGLRELRVPSLSLKPRLPRIVSLPGLVRISMRPNPFSAEYDWLGFAHSEAAAHRIAARLGEDLDAAEAQPVVFGGERVLVDADFADGFLGRKLAAAEAIDINGAAVGSGAGAGERLQ